MTSKLGLNKAWITWDGGADGGCLVYAGSASKARSLGYDVAEGYGMGGEFIEMRAKRMPKWDHPDPPKVIVETNADLHPDLDPFYKEDL